MLFKKTVDKKEWQEFNNGNIKGWQCTPFLEFPGLKHLFTSKYHDFNLGKHAPTIFPEKSVDKNREILCKSLEVPYENLFVLPLGHTTNVLILDENDPEINDSDAIVTRFPNVPVMITAADCVPILLYIPEKKILSLIHAGWKGTAGNIVEKTIVAMIENYSIRPSQIFSCIGPAIGQKNYEVDESVASALVKATGTEEILDKKWKKPRVDLKLANKIQLENMGVQNIFISSLDTSTDTNLLYSHRRQGKRAGRQALIACLS